MNVTFLRKYKHVIFQAVPSLLAILLLEVVNMEIYIQDTLGSGGSKLLYWVALQMIPGFLFSYISDLYFRKMMFIISQILGVFGGIILSIFGFELWVLTLIGLIFNPLPVARAAFLDNFPQHSRLKLMAITFLAQFGPLVFHNYLAMIPYKTVLFWVLIALAINIFLTIFLFKDNYDKGDKRKVSSEAKLSRFFVSGKASLFSTLSAFMFAEVTFYLLWAFLENNLGFGSWLTSAVMATIIGISIAMLYTRLPHVSFLLLEHESLALPKVSISYLLPRDLDKNIHPMLIPLIENRLQTLIQQEIALSIQPCHTILSSSHQLLEIGAVLFDETSIINQVNKILNAFYQLEHTNFTKEEIQNTWKQPTENEVYAKAYADQFLKHLLSTPLHEIDPNLDTHLSLCNDTLKNFPKVITVAIRSKEVIHLSN